MQPTEFSAPLLRWYDENKRVLPFRTEPTPYRVWVSEIMLQQTRVAAALPYYERFMQALPTVQALAECSEEQLLKLWEGLGYYSRARNLQKAARIVVQQYGGQLPADLAALRALPGIGEYTAGAIASIGFGLAAVAVDGNVLRVFSRLLCDKGDVTRPEVKKRLAAEVARLQPPQRPGDYNQALMELGALVCTPGAPACESCPAVHLCRARQAGCAAQLPHKAPKAKRRRCEWTAALVLREDDGARRVLLTRRPADGLLAGLWQPVLLPGRLSDGETRAALDAMGVEAEPVRALDGAKHVFTHLEWHMTGWLCRWRAGAPACEHAWALRGELDGRYALPSAVRAFAEQAKKVL